MNINDKIQKQREVVEKQRQADLTQVDILQDISKKIDRIIEIYGKPKTAGVTEKPVEMPIKKTVWHKFLNIFKFKLL